MVLSDLPVNTQTPEKYVSPKRWRVDSEPSKPTWKSFSTCHGAMEKARKPPHKPEEAPRESQSTPPKGSSLVPVVKKKAPKWPPRAPRKASCTYAAKSAGSKLVVSQGGYKPPHLRLKEQQLAHIDQSAEPRAKPAKPAVSPTQVTTGPLKSACVEIFERAHGLNGRPQEEFLKLQAEVTAQYKCSEKAFSSLVLGHSYDPELKELRLQVPGYVTKEEAKRLRNIARKAKKKAAKSVHSSPVVLPQCSPTAPHDLFDLGMRASVSNIEESFGLPPSPVDSPVKRKKGIRNKQRSHTEPEDTLQQHGGVGTCLSFASLAFSPSTSDGEEDIDDEEEGMLQTVLDKRASSHTCDNTLFAALSTSTTSPTEEKKVEQLAV